MDPNRIVVLTPCYGGGLDPDYLSACRALKDIPQIRQFGCSAVDQARALCASLGLEETRAEVLFWIDSDIVFDPNDVWRLAELCADENFDMIGGAYARKIPGNGIVARFLPDAPSVVRFFDGGQVMEVEGLGFGFLAIHRRVFEKLAPLFPLVQMNERKVRGWFVPEVDGKRYKSEDYAFIDRARGAGFKIWLDTTVRLYHKGTYAYSLEDSGQVIPDAEQLNLTISVPHSTFSDAVNLARELGATERVALRLEEARTACLTDGDLYPVDDVAAAFFLARAQLKHRVAEAGSGTGYSAACLAAGGAGVISYDENEQWQEKARQNVDKLPWGDHVTFARMTADARFPANHAPFELFLIDSTDETRFKVLPSLVESNLVDERTEIYVHDAFRSGERAILDSWARTFPGSYWEMVLERGRGVAQFHLRRTQ